MNSESEVLKINIINYIMLAITSALWILIMVLFYENILSQLLSCFINWQLKNTRISFKNTALTWFSLHLQNVCLSVENISYFKAQNISIQFNKSIKSNKKRIFCVKLKGFSSTIPQANYSDIFSASSIVLTELSSFQKRIIDFIISNSIFEMTDSTFTITNFENCFHFEAELFMFNLINFRVTKNLVANDNSDLKIKYIVCKIVNLTMNYHTCINVGTTGCNDSSSCLKVFKVSNIRIQVNTGNFLSYLMKSNGESVLFDPSIIIDAKSNSNLILYVDIWHKLFLKFLANLEVLLSYNVIDINFVLRMQLKSIQVLFLNAQSILFSLEKSKNLDHIEIVKVFTENQREAITMANFKLTNLQMKSFTNKESILKLKHIKLSVRNKECNKMQIFCYLKNGTVAYLSNCYQLSVMMNLFTKRLMLLVSDLFLLDRFTNLETIIIGHIYDYEMNMNVAETNECVQVFVERIDFKCKILDFMRTQNKNKITILANLNNNYVRCISGLKSRQMGAFAERLTIEKTLNSTNSKYQLISTPLVIGKESFVNEILGKLKPKSKENLVTSNTLFITVVQFRSQIFYNKATAYSKQHELIIGDIFGSIDFEHAVELTELINSLVTFIRNEMRYESKVLNSVIYDKYLYRSVRALSNLVNVNVISTQIETPKAIVLNLIIAPGYYSGCNFHQGNLTEYNVYNVTDLKIKVLSSLEKDCVNNNFIECGYLSLSSIRFEKASKRKTDDEISLELDYLKSADFDNKYLWFLWENGTGCACSKDCEFFSVISNLVSSCEDFAYKSCLYWVNELEEYEGHVCGFGQSIISHDMMALFSDKVKFLIINFLI